MSSSSVSKTVIVYTFGLVIELGYLSDAEHDKIVTEIEKNAQPERRWPNSERVTEEESFAVARPPTPLACMQGTDRDHTWCLSLENILGVYRVMNGDSNTHHPTSVSSKVKMLVLTEKAQQVQLTIGVDEYRKITEKHLASLKVRGARLFFGLDSHQKRFCIRVGAGLALLRAE